MNRIRSFIALGLAMAAINLSSGCLCMIPHALLHKKKSETKSEATESTEKEGKASKEGKAAGETKSEDKEKKDETHQH